MGSERGSVDFANRAQAGTGAGVFLGGVLLSLPFLAVAGCAYLTKPKPAFERAIHPAPAPAPLVVQEIPAGFVLDEGKEAPQQSYDTDFKFEF